MALRSASRLWIDLFTAASLAAALAVTCPAAGGEGAVRVDWAPAPAQVAAWSSPAPGLPPEEPLVSLKVAIPPGASSVSVTALEESWSPLPLAGLKASEGPTASLGSRASWHGIPYQEILLRPVKAGDSEGQVLLLERISLEVRYQAPEREEEETGPAGASDALPFANPGAAASARRGSCEASAAAGPQVLAAPSGFRISVSRDGVYRLDQAYLTSHGMALSGVDPRNLHLTCQGIEVPMIVEGESDGQFDPGDAVVFYGQKMPLRTRDTWNGGYFTDANAYWLTVGTAPGLRMATLDGAPQGSPTPPSTFSSTVHFEVNNYIYGIIYHYRPNGDVWFWGPPLWSGGPGSYLLGLPHNSGSPVSVRSLMAGFNSLGHAVVPALNGAAPTSGPNPQSWSGLTLNDATWTFGGFSGTSATLGLSVSTAGDYVIPDFFEVTYSRTFDADSGTLLFNAPNASSEYACPGHASAPYVLDVSVADSATGLLLPRQVTGALFSSGTASFHLSPDASVTSRTVALSSSPLAPDGMAATSGMNLSDPSLAADFLILTHPDFVDGSPSSPWQTYLARRQGQMQVLVVPIQDVYDNFSYGVFDPTAIRALLSTAAAAWAKAPRYVLLVGDASYDYLNWKGDSTFKNWVPTMMVEDLADTTRLGRYPADAWYAEVDGDGYPDMAVGRIAVRSLSDFEGVLTKIMAYEDLALSGSWYKTSVLVADKAVDPWETEFETFSNSLASVCGASPAMAQKIYYGESPYNGTKPDLCASDIRAAFGASALINYVGHGGMRNWGRDPSNLTFSDDPIRSGQSDLDLLAPSSSLPFLVNATCYTSAFEEVGDPVLSEDLLRRAGKGEIGSCGETTIGYPSEEETFTSAVFDEIFLRPKARVFGDFVEAGRFALPSANTRPIFATALLGDPTVALRIPAPPPPAVTASPGNAAVSLTWSAPATTPAAYHVYRSTDGGNSWLRLDATPIPYPAVSYLDSGLTNTQSYAYCMTALDAEGFEGPPSATVTATPANPGPPSVPTGLRAWDTGTGSSLQVVWTPNPEADVSGYTLCWGASSGAYTWSRAFSKGASSALVGGLTAGTTYFFSLTASNTSGKTSGHSLEAFATPSSLRLAIRPPAMIADLKVVRSGQDLTLSWTKPLVDVSGNPATVGTFQVFRNTGTFDWSLEGRAATQEVTAVAGQDAYSWTDAGAASIAGSVSYLVVALDLSGVRSPASVAPPSPVLDLRVARAGTSTTLSFSPVTTDIQGNPATVAHYLLYGFYPMTSPSDHVTPPGPALSSSIASPLPSCGGAVYCDSTTSPPMFYTVVAVDRRGNTSLY